MGRAQLGAVQARVRMAATRTLAVLGEGEAVRRAVGRAPLAGRGVRVLSMDGGGMKVCCTHDLGVQGCST